VNNKIKIFLVDDDLVFLKLLEHALRQHPNFDIETYASGEMCIAHLAHKPDVILLDYHLDGIDTQAMNGIDTLIKIKTTHEDILVIMLSSQDNMDIALDCMNHKATDYVLKNDTALLRLPLIINSIFNFKNL
jgi:two-component system, OmpR family, response regulator